MLSRAAAWVSILSFPLGMSCLGLNADEPLGLRHGAVLEYQAIEFTKFDDPQFSVIVTEEQDGQRVEREYPRERFVDCAAVASVRTDLVNPDDGQASVQLTVHDRVSTELDGMAGPVSRSGGQQELLPMAANGIVRFPAKEPCDVPAWKRLLFLDEGDRPGKRRVVLAHSVCTVYTGSFITHDRRFTCTKYVSEKLGRVIFARASSSEDYTEKDVLRMYVTVSATDASRRAVSRICNPPDRGPASEQGSDHASDRENLDSGATERGAQANEDTGPSADDRSSDAR